MTIYKHLLLYLQISVVFSSSLINKTSLCNRHLQKTTNWSKSRVVVRRRKSSKSPILLVHTSGYTTTNKYMTERWEQWREADLEMVENSMVVMLVACYAT